MPKILKILPLIIACFGAVLFFAKNIQVEKTQADLTGYRSCAGQNSPYECLESYFLKLLRTSDPKTTLTTLAKADTEDSNILRICHPLVHRIGRESYNIIGNAITAFSFGDETCANGYYHGVLEGYLSKSPKLEDAVVNVCKSNGDVSGYIYFQCIHGLGHGLMFKTGDDIAQSLKYCDLLKSTYDQQSCYGGVFMQNIVNDFPYSTGHGPPVVRKEDPLYPCDDDSVVGDRYKSGCYFLVTSQIIKSTYPDWSNMARWCDKVESQYRYLCYQSMGRDISGATLRDPVKGLAACQTSAPEYLGDCVQGFAKDLLEYDPRNPTAKVFCDLMETSVKGRCFSALGQMISAIYTKPEERNKACQALTSDYLSACLGVSKI